MIPIILSVALLIALIVSISVVVYQRKKAGVTGIASALTPICFYLIAVTNLLAYWLDFLGLISWTISVVLLILAAYFTKFMPTPKEVN